MPATLWIDVEDLFEYAAENTRPSGIQRMAFEICRELNAIPFDGVAVRFVRHAVSGEGFCSTEWSTIEQLFMDLTNRRLAPNALHGKRLAPVTGQGRLQKVLRPFPARVRPAIGEVAGATVALLRAVRHLISATLTGRAKSGVFMAQAPGAPVQSMQRGDVIMVLGSPWSFRDYDHLIGRYRDRFGARFALLAYDLIPVRRPEFCEMSLVRRFTDWLLPMLPLCDHVFGISQSTALDFELFAAASGIVLPDKVRTIPVGTTIMPAVRETPRGTNSDSRALPPPGSYALIVSTIEARKNHILLFRVWRRLLEDLPSDQVPTLVFAGRVGWLVDDLLRQIVNTGYLGGKLVIWESPTDAELSALYAGCLFTVFPSLYEGWGLPVTESLAVGKPCLTSNTTSLPEAGAGLTRMFDPDNLHDAYGKIRLAIDDRPGLAAWEARVRREFSPVPWSVSARALVDGLFPRQQAAANMEMAGLSERQ